VSDTNKTWEQVTADDALPTAPTQTVQRAGRSQKAKIAGALVIGGVAGAAILGPIAAAAASPTPAASTAPSSGAGGTSGSGSSGTGTAPAQPTDDPNGHQGPGFGGHNEAVSDTSVVAKAIGISEADLLTALQSGQTVADVAKAHNVDLQVVIDALVADGQAELDAAVKAGTITQAQADAQKAELTQRATDQVNGTLMGGQH
jgi:hypothetical protein